MKRTQSVVLPTEKYYAIRFSQKEKKQKKQLWKALCQLYFQQYIKKDDCVMDLGAGFCEFINAISCKKKIAVDVSSETKSHADKNVESVICSVFDIPKRFQNTVDVVFISNFLEHLETKDDVIRVLKLTRNLLKKNGTLLLLQPNISLAKERYWDFIDHKLALNDYSLKESLEVSGFETKITIRKFLPYSTKNTLLPMNTLLLKLYLSIPSIIRPFAGQTFILAKKI